MIDTILKKLLLDHPSTFDNDPISEHQIPRVDISQHLSLEGVMQS
jgi:hypothetical protein